MSGVVKIDHTGAGWRREKGGKGEKSRLAREVLWGWVKEWIAT